MILANCDYFLYWILNGCAHLDGTTRWWIWFNDDVVGCHIAWMKMWHRILLQRTCSLIPSRLARWYRAPAWCVTDSSLTRSNSERTYSAPQSHFSRTSVALRAPPVGHNWCPQTLRWITNCRSSCACDMRNLGCMHGTFSIVCILSLPYPPKVAWM